MVQVLLRCDDGAGCEPALVFDECDPEFGSSGIPRDPYDYPSPELAAELAVSANLREQLRKRYERERELEAALAAALGEGRDAIMDRLRKRVTELEAELAKRVPTDLPQDGAFIANGRGAKLTVDLWYPGVYERRNPGTQVTLFVGLMDVRASDGIAVRYDFDRDGWVILQEPGRDDDGCYEVTGPLQEVAFVKSWGLEQEVSG